MRNRRNLLIVAAAVLAGTVGGLAIALVRRGGADDGPIEAPPQPAARAALLLAAHTGNPGFATADGDVVDVYDPNCTSVQLKALIVSYRRDLLGGGARQLRCAGRPTAENIVEEPSPRTREIVDSAMPAPDAQVMTAAQQSQHDRELAADQARHAAEWAAEDQARGVAQVDSNGCKPNMNGADGQVLLTDAGRRRDAFADQMTKALSAADSDIAVDAMGCDGVDLQINEITMDTVVHGGTLTPDNCTAGTLAELDTKSGTMLRQLGFKKLRCGVDGVERLVR